jgi:VWFA-related protein
MWFSVFLSLPALAAAQQSRAPATPVPDAAEGRIKLDMVVTDKTGKPAYGLEQKDFTLLDNNHPAKILSFQAFDGTVQKADPPTEVILLLDTVNAEFQPVSYAQKDVEKFLRQNGGNLAQPVSIYLFTNQGVKVRLKPTTDGDALANELGEVDTGLRTIGRTAAEAGAIERFGRSVEMVDLIAKSVEQKPGRKLLVWVGPGWPLLNFADLAVSHKDRETYFDRIVQTSHLLRDARITLYSIALGERNPGTFAYESFLNGVKSVGRANPPNLGLKVLATQSGGRVLGPDNDLAAQIRRVIADANTFYTLSFDPPKADRANEYHDLKVQIDQPGLTARTSTGYYNQP